MREIKFRLRDFQNKTVGYEKWYEGVLHAKDGYWIAKPQWLYSIDNICWKPEYIEHRYKDQYTGLKDSNDKEIWEGHILEYILEIPLLRQATRRGYVEWDDTFAAWMVMFPEYGEAHSFLDLAETFGPSEFKTIGTVNENPELLENNE